MPVSSRLTGWIVSRFKAEPSTVPFQAPTGWCLPDCEGGTRWTAADDMAAAVAAFAKTQ